MAVVFKARHTQLDSEHAIKVLQVTGSQLRHRLLREGKVQAALRHPNVVRVTDVLDVSGSPALVMEFVDGPSLDSWLQDHTPALDEVMWLFRGIVRGVGAAHARGVVHRDLKPANVLVAPTSDGLTPKVTDFGLVKSLGRVGTTQTGMALGTPEYMSPEQIRDPRAVDQRSDMWALGCIFYELVCGQRAFAAPDRRAVFHRIVQGDFAAPRDCVPDLPDHVERVILGLLEVDPEHRLESSHKVLELLHPEGKAQSVYRVPTSLAPPLQNALPIDFREESDPEPETTTPYSVLALGGARTAEPAMARVHAQTRRRRPSTRATAEFPMHQHLRRFSLTWTMVVPMLVAIVVTVVLTVALVGPAVRHLTVRGAVAPGTELVRETHELPP